MHEPFFWSILLTGQFYLIFHAKAITYRGPTPGLHQIAPYDTAAALIAAQLWIEKNKGSSSISDDLREGLKDPSRIKLKDDCKIVATAIRYKANCIYSEDDGVQKFAQGKIEVRDVPKYLMKQAGLFDSQKRGTSLNNSIKELINC